MVLEPPPPVTSTKGGKIVTHPQPAKLVPQPRQEGLVSTFVPPQLQYKGSRFLAERTVQITIVNSFEGQVVPRSSILTRPNRAPIEGVSDRPNIPPQELASPPCLSL
jgi:hypothetical protein